LEVSITPCTPSLILFPAKKPGHLGQKILKIHANINMPISALNVRESPEFPRHIGNWGRGTRWCTDRLLPMRVKFGVLEQTQGLHFHAKFHLNVFIVSISGGQNPQFWANFDFSGLPYRPLHQRGSNVVCYRPLLAKNLNFCCFFGLQNLVVSPIGSGLRKLDMGAQLQTFPYPTTSKLFLYSNAFRQKSRAQSLTFKSMTNKQTNRQKLNVFSRSGGG